MKKQRSMSCRNVRLKTGLLAERAEVVRENVIPYQWNALNDQIPGVEPSYAIENLRIAAGEKTGEFRGFVFQDSDVAKWLEAVAYRLSTHADPDWEAKADEVIALVGRAQQRDGYLNTYYTIAEPGKRWTNLRENHELYVAGHFIEAAVAYYEATGKDHLLQIVCKFVDHIDSVFGPEEGQKKGYPGHQGIELALFKLYRVTGDESHLRLARFFIEERGKTPHYFEWEARERGDDPLRHWGKWDHSYSQSHLPVLEQTTAVGHSVRAMYLYSALADLALETDDEKILKVCEVLWNSAVGQRMYITGGLGSQEYGEGFTIDYDLPNERAYSETCAAIGLVFWAHRLLQIDPKREYGDILERALYNGVLAGMSLDGARFFYVNPLEVWPEAARTRYDHRHVEVTRQGWFGCACCPPNLARLLASINRYIYTQNEDSLFVHLFSDSELETELQGVALKLEMQTDYPWQEQVRLKFSSPKDVEFALKLRIPGWCRSPRLEINGKDVDQMELLNGYAVLNRCWKSGDEVVLALPMPIEQIRSNPKIRTNIGKVALQRGPVIYCLEEVDHLPNLQAICLPSDAKLAVEFDEDLKMPVLKGSAFRRDDSCTALYTAEAENFQPIGLKAIPYFAWDNRKSGEMLVWIQGATSL